MCFLCFQSAPSGVLLLTRSSLSIRYCAYAFLCDEDGLVRWRAVGLANTEELAMLNKMVNKLQHEKGASSSNNTTSKPGLEHQQKAE